MLYQAFLAFYLTIHVHGLLFQAYIQLAGAHLQKKHKMFSVWQKAGARERDVKMEGV